LRATCNIFVYVRQFSKKIIVSQLARCRIPSLIILHSKFKTTLKRRKVWITQTQYENVKIKNQNDSSKCKNYWLNV